MPKMKAKKWPVMDNCRFNDTLLDRKVHLSTNVLEAVYETIVPTQLRYKKPSSFSSLLRGQKRTPIEHPAYIITTPQASEHDAKEVKRPLKIPPGFEKHKCVSAVLGLELRGYNYENNIALVPDISCIPETHRLRFMNLLTASGLDIAKFKLSITELQTLVRNKLGQRKEGVLRSFGDICIAGPNINSISYLQHPNFIDAECSTSLTQLKPQFYVDEQYMYLRILIPGIVPETYTVELHVLDLEFRLEGRTMEMPGVNSNNSLIEGEIKYPYDPNSAGARLQYDRQRETQEQHEYGILLLSIPFAKRCLKPVILGKRRYPES